MVNPYSSLRIYSPSLRSNPEEAGKIIVEYISTPRNRQLAKTAKEMGLIERYGTGIRRVRNMFIEYGLNEPVYKIISGGMAVTAYGLNFEIIDEITPPITPPFTPQVTPQVTPSRTTFIYYKR